MVDKIKEIEKFIESNYSASACGLTAECSWGNNNDVFDDGYSCGYSYALYAIAQITGIEVEEPYESNDEMW